MTANPFETLDNRLSSIENILAQITHRLPDENGQPQKDIGGLSMAVEITGLSKYGIYAKVHRREIPHSKNGKRLIFSRRELVAWLTENRREMKEGGN